MSSYKILFGVEVLNILSYLKRYLSDIGIVRPTDPLDQESVYRYLGKYFTRKNA